MVRFGSAGRIAWLVALTSVFVSFLCALELVLATRGELAVISYALGGWEPPYGIEFRVDGLNAAIALLLGAAPLHAQGTDRYVTTEGELYGAILSAQPGDTITMADGRWTDAVIHFKADGVEGDSIRLRAETAIVGLNSRKRPLPVYCSDELTRMRSSDLRNPPCSNDS